MAAEIDAELEAVPAFGPGDEVVKCPGVLDHDLTRAASRARVSAETEYRNIRAGIQKALNAEVIAEIRTYTSNRASRSCS